MILAALGLLGTAVSAGSSMADMQGMGGGGGTTAAQPGPFAGLLAFLVQAGPVIMIPSIAAMVLAFGLRRRVAAIPALAAGAVMYWGMYLQPRLALMYAAIGLGFLGWAALYLSSRGLAVSLTRTLTMAETQIGLAQIRAPRWRRSPR